MSALTFHSWLRYLLAATVAIGLSVPLIHGFKATQTSESSSGHAPGVAMAADAPPPVSDPLYSGTFSSLHEPSGIIRLNDSTAVVIEDEIAKPLRRLILNIALATGTDSDQDAGQVSIEEQPMATGKNFIQRQLLGPLDDLEGVARVSDSQFFVVGSHDDATRKKQSLRQKLILFTLEDNEIVSVKVRKDLFSAIRKQYPALADKFRKAKKSTDNQLNIEGMAFDRKRGVLHIGLRTPRLKSNAVIVTLLNPFEYLHNEEKAQLADDLWQLDLEKGGIRALTYDDDSDKLLIISQRESGNSRRFKLWFVSADNSQQPTLVESKSKKLFNNVEGLTAIADGILFVKDNGLQSKQRGASWFVLHRHQLGMDR